MYDFYGMPLPEEQEDASDEEKRIKYDETMNPARSRYETIMNQPHQSNEVLIEDEFGRVQWVKQGSEDYRRYLERSRPKTEVREPYAGFHREEDSSRAKMSRSDLDKLFDGIDAARVKMTWENQLNKSEREYFTEIDVLWCNACCNA